MAKKPVHSPWYFLIADLAPIGITIGGAIGFLLGGPLGAAIGGLVGSGILIAAGFIYDAIEQNRFHKKLLKQSQCLEEEKEILPNDEEILIEEEAEIPVIFTKKPIKKNKKKYRPSLFSVPKDTEVSWDMRAFLGAGIPGATGFAGLGALIGGFCFPSGTTLVLATFTLACPGALIGAAIAVVIGLTIAVLTPYLSKRFNSDDKETIDQKALRGPADWLSESKYPLPLHWRFYPGVGFGIILGLAIGALIPGVNLILFALIGAMIGVTLAVASPYLFALGRRIKHSFMPEENNLWLRIAQEKLNLAILQPDSYLLIKKAHAWQLLYVENHPKAFKKIDISQVAGLAQALNETTIETINEDRFTIEELILDYRYLIQKKKWYRQSTLDVPWFLRLFPAVTAGFIGCSALAVLFPPLGVPVVILVVTLCCGALALAAPMLFAQVEKLFEPTFKLWDESSSNAEKVFDQNSGLDLPFYARLFAGVMGGSGLGAAIGTLIFPGVGSALGAAIGILVMTPLSVAYPALCILINKITGAKSEENFQQDQPNTPIYLRLFVGGMTGAMFGGLIGSIVPGIGNVIGIAIGTLVGAAICYVAEVWRPKPTEIKTVDEDQNNQRNLFPKANNTNSLEDKSIYNNPLNFNVENTYAKPNSSTQDPTNLPPVSFVGN